MLITLFLKFLKFVIFQNNKKILKIADLKIKKLKFKFPKILDDAASKS